MQLTAENKEAIIQTLKIAAEKILEFYQDDIKVELKEDQSPLTLADQASHKIINSFLLERFPDTPVLSEEAKILPFEERKNWNQFWLLDPLDGTKEFIKKNGEFCICLALIEGTRVKLGFIYHVIENVIYWAEKGKGAFKADLKSNNETKLEYKKNEDSPLRIVGSRSHQSEEMSEYLNCLKQFNKEYSLVSTGSALKFCAIANNEADIYPRFAPCMEWDTAAGQILIEECGREMKSFPKNEEILYNKESLYSPFFIVS